MEEKVTRIHHKLHREKVTGIMSQITWRKKSLE
jgi:hypothetical protein